MAKSGMYMSLQTLVYANEMEIAAQMMCRERLTLGEDIGRCFRPGPCPVDASTRVPARVARINGTLHSTPNS